MDPWDILRFLGGVLFLLLGIIMMIAICIAFMVFIQSWIEEAWNDPLFRHFFRGDLGEVHHYLSVLFSR